MQDKKHTNPLNLGSKAQEMLMHDVLEGMEDFVSLFGYQNTPCDFEIIPLERNAVAPKQRNDNNQKADVISYSEKKQKLALKLSA